MRNDFFMSLPPFFASQGKYTTFATRGTGRTFAPEQKNKGLEMMKETMRISSGTAGSEDGSLQHYKYFLKAVFILIQTSII